jgi:hypothetical protein
MPRTRRCSFFLWGKNTESHRLRRGPSVSAGGSIDCTVRNLSATGAALEVVTPLFIPDRFKLIIQTENLNQPDLQDTVVDVEW